jgi:hypothetical protein
MGTAPTVAPGTAAAYFGHMHHANKIATCCYCGNRTLLNLAGKVRHELACASCGAPLSRMKSLPSDEHAAPVRRPLEVREPQDVARKQRKRKKPRRLASRLFDIAEEVFDVFD